MPRTRTVGSESQAADARTLRRLYLDEHLSLADIGAQLGCSASWARQLLLRNGIAPRLWASRLRDDSVDVALATQLYQEGLSVVAVAERMRTTPDKILVRLRRDGVALRRVGRHDRRLPELSREWLTSTYVDARLSVEQIAGTAQCSPAHVRNELRRQGVRRRRAAPLPDGWCELTPALLRELYVDEGLTIEEVAGRVGGSPARVLAGLRRANIPRRPRGAPSRSRLVALTPALLHDLYVTEGLSAAEVARRVGGTDNRVLVALTKFGITRRPPGTPTRRLTITRAQLATAYLDERKSLEQIAAEHDSSAWQVRVRLRSEGIRRPNGPPRRPHPSPPATELRRLYLREGWTLADLVAHYRTGRPTVRAWLVDAGIDIAPRTTRAHRRRLPDAVVIDRYWNHGWAAADIATELDTTVDQVLRCLHDAKTPVRVTFGTDDALCVLDRLYLDPDVLAVLQRHRIPPRPEPGPIADRFPTPYPPTKTMLRSFYVRLGLSARHIELITGQPEDQILDALRAASIPVRPIGSFSPWRQRQLAGAR